MKNAIILHGCPEKEHYYNPDLPSESNAHWLSWLQKELVIRGILAQTPEMPQAHDPVWEDWEREIGRYDITPGTLLVGHSAGAGFLVQYLSIHPEVKTGKVILVGPWFDPNSTINNDFFSFEIDPDVVGRTAGVVAFYAEDDSDSTLHSLQKVRESVRGVRVREFPKGYGHFTYDNLKGEKFPELLQEILAE